jgi:hypothetical protein
VVPEEENTASRIVQSLVSGKPSSWLTGAVRTAFTGDIALGRNTVTLDSQVAEVALTTAAADADPVTLARMRTQLERSLSGLGVLQVKLTVAGRDLSAGSAPGVVDVGRPAPTRADRQGFGYLTGGELVPMPASRRRWRIPEPITAIRAATGAQRVAVQGASGIVYAVTDGRTDEIDTRPGLIPPTLDPFGYIWTVPQTSPSSILAWSSLGKSPAGPRRARGCRSDHRDGGEQGRRPARDGGERERAGPHRGRRDHPGRPRCAHGDRRGEPERDRLAGGATDIAWLDDATVGVLTTDGSSMVLRAQRGRRTCEDRRRA